MSTGYSSGFRNHSVTIQNRAKSTSGDYGIDGNGIEWEDAATVWANVEWAKGKAAMNAGALDAYAVIMVRMNWNPVINKRSRLVFEGETYQVLPETFHPDRHANTIQLHAQLIINDEL